MYKQWMKARKKFYARLVQGDAPPAAASASKSPTPAAAAPAAAAPEEGEEEEEEEEDPIPPVAQWPSAASIAGSDLSLQGVSKDKYNSIFKEMAKAMIKMDTNMWFLVPVTEDVAPDYFSVVKKPMDMGSIQNKIGRNMYKSLSAFEQDIYLMLHNATIYNPPGDEVFEVGWLVGDATRRRSASLFLLAGMLRLLLLSPLYSVL